MVLLAFLIDTSASMNQRTCFGTTYLDLAKGAVESFLKIRARDTKNSRGDRYMLVTYDEPSKSIKAGWKENLQTFMGELKNIEGLGLSDIGRALKETFDLLNMNRLQSGMENYGMGRNPYYVQSALVLLLTDGCSPMNTDGIMKDIILPMHNLLPGAELTKELYRWDQRLFTLQLKIPGFAQPIAEKHLSNSPEDMPLSNFCDQTGGKLYNIGSHKQLMQTLESVAQKIVVPGVVINFVKYGPEPDDVPFEENKPIENVYPNNEYSNEVKDYSLCNGKIPYKINGVIEGNHIDSHHLQGINGIMNGQGLLPTPPNNRIMNDKIGPIRANGDLELNEKSQIKTEGQSSGGNSIPDAPIRGNDESRAKNVISPTVPISTAWHNQRRMIYVRTNVKGETNLKASVGFWPIPESFWPDPTSSRLPPRDCQPIVLFTCKPADAMVIENIPFDKYELEPSPLTQFILQRRQPNAVWQTFVSGSFPDSEIGYPFGYLKAATSLQAVNLFVLPYNYPVVIPLLDELFKIHKCKPTVAWKQSFQEYLQRIPSYYYVPLRNAFRRMKAPVTLIPDHFGHSLSYSVVTYLKKLKHQAKNEQGRLSGMQSHNKDPEITSEIPRVPQLNDGKLRDFKELLIHNANSKKKKKTSPSLKESTSNIFERRRIPCTIAKKLPSQTLRNPYDIRHGDIVQHVARMRLQFFRLSSTTNSNNQCRENSEEEHNTSIAQMGDYQEHLKQFKPLREVDPSQVRVHTFGNPFKLKQDQIIAVDEADVTENMPLSGQNQRKRSGEIVVALQKGKRKRIDTPPPSRKPVGTPNTPPPNSKNKIDDMDKRNELNRIVPDHKGILKDLTGSLDRINSLDSTNEKTQDATKKQSNSVVSKQLRKLQQIHRNKKENFELSNEKITEDLTEQIDSGSPILSILRTSLEESDDTSNDEVSRITEGNVNFEDENGTNSSTTTSSNSNTVTPVSILSPLLMEDMFRNMPAAQLKNVYKELHSRKAVKTRLAIWQAIRNRKDFTLVEELVKELPIGTEARYMFVMNLIYEAEKFQHVQLEDKLKTILRDIQLIKNG